MNRIIALYRKDWASFWSDRVAVFMTFFVPAAIIFLLGNIFGGDDSGPSGIRIAIVNQSKSVFGEQIIETFSKEKTFRVITEISGNDGNKTELDEKTVRELMSTNRFRFGLIVSERPGFEGVNVVGLPDRLKLLYNPRNDIENQVVQGLLQRTIFTELPEFMIESFKTSSRESLNEVITEEEIKLFESDLVQIMKDHLGVDSPIATAEIKSWLTGEETEVTDGASQGSTTAFFQDAMDEFFDFEKEQIVGKKVSNPGATREVAGYSVMFMLFSLSFAATSLLSEKKSDLFPRILSSGASRTDVLWSKFLFTASLGWVQLMALFFFGWLFFRIDFFPNLPQLAFIFIFISASVTSYGMLLASVCKTEAQASGLSTLLNISMSALGGAWFPVSFMPETIQFFSKLTIVYWAQSSLLDAIWNDGSMMLYLPKIGILVLVTIVVSTISIWRFKTGNLFQR